MPNWCANVVTFKHSNPAEIKRMETAFAEGGMMQEFVPCPEELLNTDANFVPNSIMLEKYGASSWYEWKLANWGTKWDLGDAQGINTVDTNSILVYFDSAWSPPIVFYNSLSAQGWNIEAYYYEPGMAFCGTWTNDEGGIYYEITGNSDWVVDNIPSELDEMFAISENMSAYESEEELAGEE